MVISGGFFHSSLVKVKGSGPRIISEAFNPALCSFLEAAAIPPPPWPVQAGETRIKQVNCEVIRAFQVDCSAHTQTSYSGATMP